eukprot:7748405-Pyramimonas_sp.AAC.1
MGACPCLRRPHGMFNFSCWRCRGGCGSSSLESGYTCPRIGIASRAVVLWRQLEVLTTRLPGSRTGLTRAILAGASRATGAGQLVLDSANVGSERRVHAGHSVLVRTPSKLVGRRRRTYSGDAGKAVRDYDCRADKKTGLRAEPPTALPKPLRQEKQLVRSGVQHP